MVASELGWTAVFQDDCVDDVAAETRHAPPPRLVACTMSCDMGELCPELRHLPLRQCPVSGHRGHLLQDIVHRPAASERLVVALWVDGEFADELTILGDDSDVRASDK